MGNFNDSYMRIAELKDAGLFLGILRAELSLAILDRTCMEC